MASKLAIQSGKMRSVVGPPAEDQHEGPEEKVRSPPGKKKASSDSQKKVERLKRRLKERKHAGTYEGEPGKVQYVGRIGDADEFIRKLRRGEVELEDFKDPEYRRKYEGDFVFPFEDIPIYVMRTARVRHDTKISTKKLYLKSKPRFTFIGRYDFQYKKFFVLVWSMISVKGSKRGLSRFMIKNDKRDSRYTSSEAEDESYDSYDTVDRMRKRKKRERKKAKAKAKAKKAKKAKKKEKEQKKTKKGKKGKKKKFGLNIGFKKSRKT